MQEKKRTRIVWNKSEIDEVAQAAVLLHLEDIENVWTLIERAQQEVLPKNRHRKIVGNASIPPGFIERFQETRKKYLEDLQIVKEVEVPVEKIVNVERSTEEVLQSVSTEELMIILIKRLGPIISRLPDLAEKLIGENLPTSTSVSTETTVEAELPTKTKTQKIFLVEFLPRQEEIIRQKVKKENLDVVLVFGGKNRRERVPSSCTDIISNIKTSHSNYGRVQKQANGRKVHISTGTDNAVMIIRRIIQK